MKGLAGLIGTGAFVLACAIPLLVLGMASSQSLYEKVITASEDARTIHIVDKRLVDGEWVKKGEDFYDRSFGMTSYRYHEGKTTVRHRGGPRSDGVRPLDVVALFLVSEDAVSELGTEKVVDGVACRGYVQFLPKPKGSWARTRLCFWIGRDNRLRLYEEQRQRGQQWVTCGVSEIKYDVPNPSVLGRYELFSAS